MDIFPDVHRNFINRHKFNNKEKEKIIVFSLFPQRSAFLLFSVFFCLFNSVKSALDKFKSREYNTLIEQMFFM